MQQSELKALEQHIQAELQQSPNSIRLKVRCAFREEALLVLAEHLLHVEPVPRQIFTTVADTLQQYTPQLMMSGLVRSGVGGTRFLPVRIYLRVAGYQQPYDSFVFSLKPSAPTVSANSPIPTFVPPPVVTAPPESAPLPQAQVEPEMVEAEPSVAVEPVVAVEPIARVPLAKEITPIEEGEPVAEIEPVPEAPLVEEQPEILDSPIAKIAPPPEPLVEPEIIELAPVAEVPLAEAIAPVEEVEPVAEVPLIEEQPEILDSPIAKIAPAIESTPVIQTSDPQTDWLLDTTIAEVTPVEIAELEPLTPEAAVNEPVLAESTEVRQLLALEEPITEKIAEELPIVEEVAVAPTIAFEELSVEPEAEEAPDLQETTPSQDTVIVSAAIASVADNISPTVDTTSLAQDKTQDESELAPILLEESIVEEAIVTQNEPESVINLQKDSTLEEPIQSVTFPQPIQSLYLSTFTLQPTSQDFPSVYSTPTEAKPIEPTSLAELEEVEIANEPEVIELADEPEVVEPEVVEPETIAVFDLPELDTTIPGSFLAPELREAFESENLVTDPVPPSEAIITAESAIAKKTLTTEPYTHDDLAPPISTASSVSEDPTITQAPSHPIRVPQLSSSSIMLGAAIALFGLLGGWYILSRPCVLGSSCEPLQRAQQISQAAFQTVQSTESAIAIAKAYDDLGTANKLLQSIPSWSGQHQAAQALFADNESKSEIIGQLVRTLKKGNEAANRSQNPPHPLPEWREIQRLWRESIAALEKISSNTAIYPVAQRKAAEYRINLEGINKRVVVEQQAQEEVENAKKTAQLAETRTGIATSAAGWQEVYTSWQATINLLKNVPKGAAARLEAEELLKIYQAKLAAAGIRRDQETTAIAAYTEAIAQAEQAQSFQQKNQWQNAIATWNSAIGNVQRVAQGTTPYAQAQPLIATYQTALTQAQSGLQVSEAIQAAKPALDRTCSGTPKVCLYDAAPTAIRVQITYGYDQMVESAMVSAQVQGNSTAQAGVVSQVNTFLQELALISQTSQVPIDLYNANGSKFGTYSPKASGFIPQ